MNYQIRVPSSEFRVSPHAEPETRNPELGFSLVEVVIAMAILAVGLYGAIRVFPVGLQASHRSEQSSRAMMVVGRTLELAKLKACPDITDEETTTEGMTVKTHVATPAIPHLADPTRVKSVELTIEWQQNNRPRRQVFLTYVRCIPQ